MERRPSALLLLIVLLATVVSFHQTIAARPLRAQIAEDNSQLMFHKRKYSLPHLDPEQPAAPFSVSTLKGKFLYLTNNSLPLLFNVFSPLSGVSDCLWKETSYIDSFLTTTPLDVDYLFLSYSNSTQTLSDVINFHTRVQERLLTLNITKERRSKLNNNLHFVTTPALELHNWISDLLRSWNYPLSQLAITVSSNSTGGKRKSQTTLVKRLDARYDWLPSPISLGNQAFEVVYLDNSCQLPLLSRFSINFTNKFVLAKRSDPCSFTQKVMIAQKLGASGLLVFANQGQNLVDMNCVNQECNVMFNIPASMISYEDGIFLKNLIQKQKNEQQSVKISFSSSNGQPIGFGIQYGKIKEIGWLLFPSLQFYTFQAQWFDYVTELEDYLAVTKPITTEVLVFDSVSLFKTPVAVQVSFNQSVDQLLNHDAVELDLSLSCPGTGDSDCPPWDRVISVTICCENSGSLCGQELGRYISPFRRKIGRWITPVTSQMPLFTSNKCNFTIATDPWILKPWMPSLRLRFLSFLPPSSPSKHTPPKMPKEGSLFRLPKQNTLHPFQIIPIFKGGVFDKTYNSKYQPFQFQLPPTIKKVELVSIITGHGSDNNNCAEFCVTSHHFWVNKEYEVSRTFDNAGTAMGCALEVPQGSVPNEHGTWLYGRDGWCDGQNVLPWVVDITRFVKKNTSSETSNEIWYQGYFNGATPNPTANPGQIIMSSWLVYWTDTQ